MAKMIEPKILKGFRDTLPDFEIRRKKPLLKYLKILFQCSDLFL